jgi:K+-transporting ATPase KdpF subunit
MRVVIRRCAMNALYLIAGLIALALFGYLVVALLKPEIF